MTLFHFGYISRAAFAAFLFFSALANLPAAENGAKRMFDIPAGEAARALRSFAQQSGLELLYSPREIAGAQTKAVHGEFPPRSALDQMLEGSDLVVAETRSKGTIAVTRASSPNVQGAAPATGVRPGEIIEPAPIQLSPFTTTADRDVGYVATSSLAGSRLNTPLKDTAASISVMTTEFLSDIGATDLTEALEWGNNVQRTMADEGAFGAEPNPNGFFSESDNFRVRGIGATVTRNYFAWSLPTDNYNVARIEESRGPNSILFGIGSAGGIINISTKQALTARSFRHADATVGSYGGYRGTIDVNQTALNHNLAVRLNALYDHEGSWRTYGFSNRRRIDLAASYNLTANTRVRAEYETGDNHENIASGNSVGDGSTPWLAAGRPTLPNPIPVPSQNPFNLVRYAATRITYIEDTAGLMNLGNQNASTGFSRPVTDETIASRTINTGGPGQLRDSYFNALSAFLEQKIGSATFLEFAYNHQDTHSVTYQAFATSPTLSFDPNQTLPAPSGSSTRPANPYSGRLMFDGNWRRLPRAARLDNTRITISTEHDFGKWGDYRLAGLAEYEARADQSGPQFEVWSGRPFNAAPENAANQVFRRNYVTEGDWSTYYTNGPAQTGLIHEMREPVTGRTLSSTWVAQNNGQQDNPSYQKAMLLGAQARYFHGRLVLGAGYREDRLDATDRAVVRDPATNEFTVDYGNKAETTYKGRTRTLGVVAHVTPTISLLYNRSDNFDLPNLNIRVLPDSLNPGNPRGKGEDMGVALDLFGGKINARAVYYTSASTGEHSAHGFGSAAAGSSPTTFSNLAMDALLNAGLISAADADARRVTANGIIFDRSSEGYEFMLTGNPTKNWRLQANYSYTSSFENNIGLEVKAWADTMIPFLQRFPGTTTAANFGNLGGVIAQFEEAMAEQFALEGQDVLGNRKQKMNLFTRYTFSDGPLKGGFIGGGYRHQSKNSAGRTGAGGDFIYGRSFWLADALIGYRFDRLAFLRHVNLQLNVANVFDDDKPLITSFADNGTIRRWVTMPGRSWRLSARIEF